MLRMANGDCFLPITAAITGLRLHDAGSIRDTRPGGRGTDRAWELLRRTHPRVVDDVRVGHREHDVSSHFAGPTMIVTTSAVIFEYTPRFNAVDRQRERLPAGATIWAPLPRTSLLRLTVESMVLVCPAATTKTWAPRRRR